MIPLYRIIEICVYSLLNFLPFMALALYPFRSRLRFSVKITVCIIVVISFIQMGLGLWAAFFFGRKGGACECGKHCGVCGFLFYCD
ncbi:MAG: hypothetical protein ACLR5P_05920 [[Eubacterium] siraeum]